MIIQAVYKVKNTFLKGMYLLKKEEYKVLYGFVSEHLLYHVTSAANVQSIIQNNFDWRRVKRGRFGLGTSFSDDVKYANKHANIDSGRLTFILSAFNKKSFESRNLVHI